MAETTWDEVGKRFADLGRELQRTWQASASSSEAKEHLNDAGEKVRVALDDVAQTINRAAASSEVRDAAKDAGNGIAEALSATLVQVVEWIEQAPKTWAPPPPPSYPPPPPPKTGPASQEPREPQAPTSADDIQNAVIVDEGPGDATAEQPAATKKAAKRAAKKKPAKKAADKATGKNPGKAAKKRD